MKYLIIMMMLLSSAVSAYPVTKMVLVGQSEMNWIFWKLYDIQLYSADGTYIENTFPVALSITYARDITSSQLVQSTLDEWKRLSLVYKPQWTDQLQQIFPSVKSKDKIDFVVNATGHNQFYFNHKLIGEISDPEFSQAFLAIWLSPETREPELRKKITGESNA